MMPERQQQPLSFDGAAEPRWHWRNCRSIGFSVEFWPLDWSLEIQSTGDVYGGQTAIAVGPVVLCLYYDIGNCSSYGPERRWALSEVEAYSRAVKFEEPQ